MSQIQVELRTSRWMGGTMVEDRISSYR